MAISETAIAFIAVVFVFSFGMSLVRVTVSVIDKRARLLWRIDAKLDLLLKHFGIDFDPHKSPPHEVVDAMQRGEKIRAIKYYRDATGAPLKDAKVFIEEAERRVNLS
jgi:hypothetical protein